MIIRRDIHAVVFGSAVAAVALVDAAERTGLRGALLGSLITDVVVAGAAAESVGPFLGRSVPALWVESRDAAELAAVLTAELVRRRRQFVARGIRFALQGNVLFIDGTAVRLDRGSATVLRALAAHPGATLSRSALARMSGQARAVGVNGSDVAVSRLRSALGEHCWLVATTFRYGYRLAVDDAAPELE